jgi:NAD dependent epimerase/dehydratase family enzyme
VSSNRASRASPSAATIYAHRFDAPNDEATGTIGGRELDAPCSWRASIDIARAWEAALYEAPTLQTRRVALRSAMVMSPEPGGPFDALLALMRRGLGGPIAGGRQYISWIHDRDFVRAIQFLLTCDSLDGPVNLAAPQPFPQRDFMAALRTAWGAPVGLPSTRWMLEIGAVFLRTETELVLKSRRVVPSRLLDAGFSYEYPQWPAAAGDLVARWCQQHQ